MVDGFKGFKLCGCGVFTLEQVCYVGSISTKDVGGEVTLLVMAVVLSTLVSEEGP